MFILSFLKPSSRLVRFATSLVLLVLLLALTAVSAQMVSSSKETAGNALIASKIKEGQVALDNRNFEKAVAAFQVALTLAVQSSDRTTEADCDFYLGLARQQQAASLGWGPSAQSAILDSEKYYQNALKIRPDSPALLNNLGQLYSQTGRDAAASELLKRAVSQKGRQSEIAAQNYAVVLEKTGQTASASQYYAMAAITQPANTDAYERAVASYIKSNPNDLAGYLWDALKSGQVLRVQQSAIRALQQGSWNSSQKAELLAIVAQSLSEQSYQPSTYQDSFAAQNLATFAGDAAIGEAIRELSLLHQSDLSASAKFTWWAGAGDPYKDPPRGVWPIDAFRALIRSLGDWYQRQDDNQRAEIMYRLAIVLNRQEIDPVACLSLADLYISHGRAEKIDALMQELSPQLFYGKGEAYRNSQWKKTYAFHRTLGLIYSYQRRWGNNATPASAIFQLEHAMDAASLLKIMPEARLVDSLATAYENVGRQPNATALRLNYAQQFVTAKDFVDAGEILAVLKKQNDAGKLTEPQVVQFKNLIQAANVQ